MNRILTILIVGLLAFGLVVPASYAELALNLPEPHKIKPISPAYQPVVLKAVTVNPKDPFLFDFLIDKGDSQLEGEALEAETQKLVKYFLAAVTIPEKDLWVNLSPYEQDAMIPQTLGITELGKDLLVDDYILKQVTAGLTNPNTETGKQFWAKAYAKAQELYGTTQIPINTFSKVWIVPDHAEILEKDGSAFVASSHLKVYLDEDYLAIKNNLNNKEIGTDKLAAEKTQNINNLSTEIIREVVLPQIEKEINTGKNFALVRQVYSSAILAAWYKKRLKDSILGQLYADQGKVAGVNADDFTVGEKIYEQYTQALKTGVYNIIKQDYDLSAQKVTQRKYFSGGVKMAPTASTQIVNVAIPEQMRNLSGAARETLRAASSAMTSGQYVTARVQVARPAENTREEVAKAMQSTASPLATILRISTPSGAVASTPGIADRPEVVFALNSLRDTDIAQVVRSLSIAEATQVSREAEAIKTVENPSPITLAQVAPRTTELLRTNPGFLEGVVERDPGLQDMRVWTQLANISKPILDERLESGDLSGLSYEEKKTIQLAHAEIQKAAEGQDQSRILSIVSTMPADVSISLSRVMKSAFTGQDGRTTNLAQRMLSDLERPKTFEQTGIVSTLKATLTDLPGTQLFIRDHIPGQDQAMAYRELSALRDLDPQANVVDIARVAPTLVKYVSQPTVANDLARALSINTANLDNTQALVGLATASPNPVDLDLHQWGFSPKVIGDLTAAQIAVKKAVKNNPALLSQPEALIKASPQAMAVFTANPTLREYYVSQTPEHKVLEIFANLSEVSEAELNRRIEPLNLVETDRLLVQTARREIGQGIEKDPNFETHPELKRNSLLVAKSVTGPTARALSTLIAQRPEVFRSIVQPTMPVVAAAQQLAVYRLITDTTDEQLTDWFDRMQTEYKVEVTPADRRAIFLEKRAITTDHKELSIINKASFAPTIMAWVSKRERAQQLLSVSATVNAASAAVTPMTRMIAISALPTLPETEIAKSFPPEIPPQDALKVATALKAVSERNLGDLVIPTQLAKSVAAELQSQGIEAGKALQYAFAAGQSDVLGKVAQVHTQAYEAKTGQTIADNPKAQLNALGPEALTKIMVSQLTPQVREQLKLIAPAGNASESKQRAFAKAYRDLETQVGQVIANPDILNKRSELAKLELFAQVHRNPSVTQLFSDLLGSQTDQGRRAGFGASSGTTTNMNYIRGIFAPNVTEEQMRRSIDNTLSKSRNFSDNVERGNLADDLVQVKQRAKEDENFALKIAAANNVAELQAVVKEAKVPVSPSFAKLTDRDVQKLGGIDLSAQRMDLQIKRDGNGVPLDFPLQDVGNLKIEGLAPVILDMQPATPQNASFLMNLAASSKK